MLFEFGNYLKRKEREKEEVNKFVVCISQLPKAMISIYLLVTYITIYKGIDINILKDIHFEKQTFHLRNQHL